MLQLSVVNEYKISLVIYNSASHIYVSVKALI